MIKGVFVEQPTDVHVGLRCELLDGGAALPEPEHSVQGARAADFPEALDAVALAQLAETGLAMFELDEPLSNERFLELGGRLGTQMSETDPAVQPYVENAVILNLRTDHRHTADTSLQPFAANFLTLHSESSGRPVEDQPRYIVLMCVQPGDDSAAAQTVLVPMAAVERQLAGTDIDVLKRTRYRRSERGPPIARGVAGRHVFSFRDFASQALEWSCLGHEEDIVDGAIRRLLASMYSPHAAVGIRWKRGALLIVDNTFHFHGRTAAGTAPSVRTRHLKRLRVV